MGQDLTGEPSVAELTAHFVSLGLVLQSLASVDVEFGKKVEQSIAVLNQALDEFTPLGLAVSFNAQRGQLDFLCGGDSEKGKMTVAYFEKDELEGVVDFMNNVFRYYGLSRKSFSCDYKQGMGELVEGHQIEAVVMGQRYGDPWTSDLEMMEPSSPGWPKFIRVNPVLKWKFSHVWLFLRECKLPYCRLYDEGYTSLGEANETQKNPALLQSDGITYKKAHELVDEDLERVSRTPSPNASGKAKKLEWRELDEGGKVRKLDLDPPDL